MKKSFLYLPLFLGSLFIICCQNTAPKTEKTDQAPIKPPTNQFVVVKPDAGKVWNIFGLQIVGKIMSEETAGQYSVIMSHTPPKGGPPPHVHQHEDEAFYVLKGKYLFTCGKEKIEATEGTLVHLPRGIPHTFQNISDSTGVLLNTITPGGFEQFFAEIDKLPKDQPLDREKVTTIAAFYGLQFLPPQKE